MVRVPRNTLFSLQPSSKPLCCSRLYGWWNCRCSLLYSSARHRWYSLKILQLVETLWETRLYAMNQHSKMRRLSELLRRLQSQAASANSWLCRGSSQINKNRRSWQISGSPNEQHPSWSYKIGCSETFMSYCMNFLSVLLDFMSAVLATIQTIWYSTDDHRTHKIFRLQNFLFTEYSSFTEINRLFPQIFGFTILLPIMR